MPSILTFVKLQLLQLQINEIGRVYTIEMFKCLFRRTVCRMLYSGKLFLNLITISLIECHHTL